MSRASREWKKTCKNDNRLTNGTSWSKKDMTLSSYKSIKRYDRRFNRRRNMRHLIEGLKELDNGNGMDFNPFEGNMAMVEHGGISHPAAISGDVFTITTAGGKE